MTTTNPLSLASEDGGTVHGTEDAIESDGPVGGIGKLIALAAIGAAVSLALGIYAKEHTPTNTGISTFGFSAVLPMKAWSTTIAATLGLAQLASAAWMWGRLPGVGPVPTWIGPAHRWLGTVAFLFTLPAAYHCMWSLGFQDYTTRVLAHSLLGCAFYGAFTTKMLVLRSKALPGWALPATGALLVTVLTAIWLTSSLWYFQNFGFPAT